MTGLVDFEGKRVVVTGAASGIGAATARLVAELGGTVTAIDIKEPTFAVADYLHADLGQRAAIDAAVAQLGGGVIDAVVNCAGIGNVAPGQHVMSVNFLGPRYLTESLVPLMRRGSAVCFVASTSGLDWMRKRTELLELMGIPDYDEAKRWCEERERLIAEGYSFGKMAIIAYTAWRSVALLTRGIRLNCTAPRMETTPMVDDHVRVNGQEGMDSFPRPMGRDSTPEEQANLLALPARATQRPTSPARTSSRTAGCSQG